MKIRIGVLFGGKSAEHEVSLQSARNVIQALDPDRFEVVLIGIDRKGNWRHNTEAQELLAANAPPPALTSPGADDHRVVLVPGDGRHELVRVDSQASLGRLDVIFPVLHGPYGEDGTIQGLLKLADIPFVGAGVVGSAVGMDKDVMKRLLLQAGIPTARYRAFRRAEDAGYEELARELGETLFVKPANLGSSVGISKVRSAAELAGAMAEAFRYDRKVIVEELIEGREIECSVLGNEEPVASVPGEIIPQDDFYSYEAKYLDENGAILEVPAGLDGETSERIRRMAVRVFTTLCCEGMGRVDFFLRPDGLLYVNEINTIPGFTRISMYPKLWEASGMSTRELVGRLVDLALERARTESGLKTSREE